jgi:hypothetical protein
MLEIVATLRGQYTGRALQTILEILEGNNSQNISEDIPISDVAQQVLSTNLKYQFFY